MKKYTSSIIFVVLFIPTIYFVHRYSVKKTESVLNGLHIEYPNIKYGEMLEGKVTNCYQGDLNYIRDSNHEVFVTINDTVKRYLLTGYELNSDILLQSVVKVGSHLFKDANSNRIKVINLEEDSVNYCFELTY